MEMVFWTGEKPGRPMTIRVLDSNNEPVDLSGYAEVNVRMLDANNIPLDLTGSATAVAEATGGLVLFNWPSDRSLFTTHGEYLLQLEMKTATAVNYTTVAGVLVKKFGGVVR